MRLQLIILLISATKNYQIERASKHSVPTELYMLSFFSLVFKSAWANIYYGVILKISSFQALFWIDAVFL